MRTASNRSCRWLVPAIAGCFCLFVTNARAEDWPQWRGPNRDDISQETGLNLDWSQKKPPLLWAFKQAGAGYSGPTIVGGTLYCQGAADGNDFVFALDTETGKLKWKQPLGPQFVQDRGDGPRGSVTVDGGALYLIRGGGALHCLAAADGKARWQKSLKSDLGGAIMSAWDWGYSESPLVDGDLVICTPGGAQGTLAALNKKTGEVVWRSTDWKETGGYSSPIVAEVDGVRQYIQLTRGGVAGVAAKDGTLLWSANVAGNRTAVIPTPIYHDHLYTLRPDTKGAAAASGSLARATSSRPRQSTPTGTCPTTMAAWCGWATTSTATRTAAAGCART